MFKPYRIWWIRNIFFIFNEEFVETLVEKYTASFFTLFLGLLKWKDDRWTFRHSLTTKNGKLQDKVQNFWASWSHNYDSELTVYLPGSMLVWVKWVPYTPTVFGENYIDRHFSFCTQVPGKGKSLHIEILNNDSL